MADIYIFGDSITWGAYDDRGGWADRIKQDYQRQKLDDMDSDRSLVYNLGIPGETSEGLAQRIDQEVKSRKTRFSSPDDVYVVAIGINDSRFKKPERIQKVQLEQTKENWKTILNTLSIYSKNIAFIGLTPVVGDFSDYQTSVYTNEEIKRYDLALEEFCKSNSASYVPLFESMKKLDLESLLPDSLHPNTEGHKWMYDQIKPHILELLGK